ncbi:hypothetical protein [Ideonella sp.]
MLVPRNALRTALACAVALAFGVVECLALLRARWADRLTARHAG